MRGGRLLFLVLCLVGLLYVGLVAFVLVHAVGQIGDGLGMWEWT